LKDKKIDDLQKDVTQLQDKVNQLDQSLAQCCMNYSKTGAGSSETGVNDNPKLEQNIPNPFTQNTVIKFYIPQNAGSAVIKVYSLDGSELKSIVVSTKGFGETEISGNTLSAGTYTYMLILDGKVVDTKQMVLTK
jgi:hypothetical protein